MDKVAFYKEEIYKIASSALWRRINAAKSQPELGKLVSKVTKGKEKEWLSQLAQSEYPSLENAKKNARKMLGDSYVAKYPLSHINNNGMHLREFVNDSIPFQNIPFPNKMQEKKYMKDGFPFHFGATEEQIKKYNLDRDFYVKHNNIRKGD